MNARKQLLVVLVALLVVCSGGAMAIAGASGSGVDQSTDSSEDEYDSADADSTDETDTEQEETDTATGLQEDNATPIEPDDGENETDAQQGAYVTFNDQTTEGDTVVVENVSLASPGFVTIHNSSLLVGNVFESVIGTSAYLEAGTHENVEITLDEPLEEDETLIAMPHRDTNDNETYDFVETEGAADGPFLTPDDEPVTDDAVVTVDGMADEEPVEEEPVDDNETEDNVTDEPVEEEPVDDNETDDVTDEPVDDNETDDVTDEPVDDNETDDVTDEPVEEEPVEEEPVDDDETEDDVTDEPVDDNETDDNVTDEPVEEDPFEEEPTDDDNVTEEPIDELPVDGEQQPVFVTVEELTVEDLTVENATVYVLVVGENVTSDNISDELDNVTEDEMPVEEDPFEDNETDDNVTDDPFEDNETDDNVTDDPFEDNETDDNVTDDPFEDNETDDNVTDEPTEEVTAESFTVSNLEAPESATVGEDITVTADIENPTDEERTEAVQFRLEGDLLAQEDVTLESGASTEIEFEVDTSNLAAGTYTHMVLTDEAGELATLELTEETDDGLNETTDTDTESALGFIAA
ncbi:DUF7282 domain-containing protein [Natrinema salinisoli]|uniref:DUF7282 domain-containing protein n=1 Tax=Natrinema salinisoli TaxID=2878535 RepID=UPI001CF02C70|nr:hypothetical protein [Natrinema salinisoli]